MVSSATIPYQTKMNDDGESYGAIETQYIRRHHWHEPRENQCTSALVKHIRAPFHLVWSLVRSGFPATISSTERLEQLDDEEHIHGIRIVGGDHRLNNYSSIITVHPEVIDGRPGTMVIKSFVVDVPNGNSTRDGTCYFMEALIRCNLSSLAEVSKRMTVQGWTDPIMNH